MKQLYTLSLLVLFAAQVYSQNNPSRVYVHTAAPGNITFNQTKLDHEALNGAPDAYPFFTHNWNPGGLGGTDLDHKLGTYFQNDAWRIFLQPNITPFVQGSAFNVLVPGDEYEVFFHESNASNTTSNQTRLSHPSLNDNPNAIFMVADVYGGKYNTNVLGVYYVSGSKEWRIYNQGGTSQSLAEGLGFSVIIPKQGSNVVAWKHRSDANNIISNTTRLDHPLLDGNPNALVFITPIFNTNGSSIGVYNDHNTGVYYEAGHWRIFNEDKAAMPNGASFNVIAYGGVITNVETPAAAAPSVQIGPNPQKAGHPVGISLHSHQSQMATITIVDITGKTIHQEACQLPAGKHQIQWSTHQLTPGMYFATIQTEEGMQVKKMVLQ